MGNAAGKRNPPVAQQPCGFDGAQAGKRGAGLGGEGLDAEADGSGVWLRARARGDRDGGLASEFSSMTLNGEGGRSAQPSS
jgi:hypothetical protein